MLKNIQSHLNLTYLNNDEHTHLDRAKGSTDILDMAFISPNLTKHDIQFLTGDDLGSNHLPIEISVDAQPHRNTHTNPIRYKFNQIDREVFESTLEKALSWGDIPELKSTQGINKKLRGASWVAVQQMLIIWPSLLPRSYRRKLAHWAKCLQLGVSQVASECTSGLNGLNWVYLLLDQNKVGIVI